MVIIKRIETKIIEKVLLNSCFGSNPKLATDYGTTEVTIDFLKTGRELVDFMSYNARKDVIKCYEIKVTMEDFRSNAKKSWHGNYNYLVISNDLYSKMSLDDWKKEIPKGVGIIVVGIKSESKEIVLRAVKKDISQEIKDMLKNCLIRSMFYQNVKTDWELRNFRLK